MKRIYSKYKSILNLALVIILLAVFNIVANQIFLRIDLSSDQIHSLSPKTKDLLVNLEDIISADVYLEGDTLLCKKEESSTDPSNINKDKVSSDMWPMIIGNYTFTDIFDKGINM